VISSQYILDIFDLLFDDHQEESLLRNQVPYLTQTYTDHTGVGAFIHFAADNEIEKFRLNTNAGLLDIYGNSIDRIDGLEIRNSSLSILADATVHLKEGIIDSIEIFNKGGGDYVSREPEHYELNQMWLDEGKRRNINR
jgi:hypothetical protein